MDKEFSMLLVCFLQYLQLPDPAFDKEKKEYFKELTPNSITLQASRTTPVTTSLVTTDII